MLPTVYHVHIKGTQRQFFENICSEDDLRSRIFGTFVVEFLAFLIFEYLKGGIIAHFQRICTVKRSPRMISFDRYNFGSLDFQLENPKR